ncbi:MAG: hypothetical protein IPP34_03205 [Bacteroidetes bacterium]|nr:hypothetical protein [Bacteroidota bacterium]
MQLTTTGDLSFELNIEIEETNGGSTNTVKYVASNDTLLLDEVVSPFLKYPSVCGCTDPDYLEYNSSFACNDAAQCLTLVVFGCMDTLACNYDSQANFSIPHFVVILVCATTEILQWYVPIFQMDDLVSWKLYLILPLNLFHFQFLWKLRNRVH